MTSTSPSQSVSRLLSASDKVTVWDPPPDFSFVHSFNPHEGCSVGSISWNHDFTIIASAGINHDKVYVTYAPAGYVSHDLEAEGLPCSVRFANFTNTLSVGTSTGVVQLWDVKTRKVKKTFQGSKLSRITSTAFNHNDGFIAAGTSGGEISLLNTVTGVVTPPMIASKSNCQPITAIQYSFHRKAWLASSSDNGSVYLWDVNTRQLLHPFREVHQAPATGLTFSTLNEMFMLSAGLDNNIVCYDVRERKTLKTISTDHCLSALDLMPDGVTLAVGSTRGKILIFDLRKGNTPIKTFNAHKDKVHKLAFQKCGSKRAAALERSSSSGGMIANREASGKSGHKGDRMTEAGDASNAAPTTAPSSKSKKHQHGSSAAPSKPTRDANDNEEISTHHGVTATSSSHGSGGYHSGGGGTSSSHKHHSRKASGGEGVGDGGGAISESGVVAGAVAATSEGDAVTSAAKETSSSGGVAAASTKGGGATEATTPSNNAHHQHHQHHMRHKSHNAVISNLHSTSSSIDDIFSPLRGQSVPGGRTSSQADSSVLSTHNHSGFSSIASPVGLASGNKSLSKSASGLFRSQYPHGKSSLADDPNLSIFSSVNSPYLNEGSPGADNVTAGSANQANITDGSASLYLSPRSAGAHSHHQSQDAPDGESSAQHGTSHSADAENYHPVNGNVKGGLSVPPSTLPEPLISSGGGGTSQLPSPNPNAPFTCLHKVKDPATLLGGTSFHNHHHHHHHPRKEKADSTERPGSSKHHLHHQPHSHDGVTGTQGQQQQHQQTPSPGAHLHPQPSYHQHLYHHHQQPHQHSVESSFRGNSSKGVNEACCAGPQLSSAIHIRRDGAGPPGLDPGCATSPPLGFAPSILGPGAAKGFTAVPPSLMHKSASSTHLRKSPVGEMIGAGDGGGGACSASLYAGASSLGPLPPSSSSTSPPGGGLHTGAAHCGLLASGGAVGGSSRLVPVLGDPNMSSSDQAFHVQYFKNILLEEIDDLRDDIRSYVLQIQFEMIRQFEIQLAEIQQMLHMDSVRQHQLMKENEALKEEIRNLKKIY